jgi:hypothetical protein
MRLNHVKYYTTILSEDNKKGCPPVYHLLCGSYMPIGLFTWVSFLIYPPLHFNLL